MPSDLEPRIPAALLMKSSTSELAEIITDIDDAIAGRYPQLSGDERKQVTLVLLGRIVKALKSETEEVGFFEQDADGTVRIKTLAIERVAAEVAQGGA